MGGGGRGCTWCTIGAEITAAAGTRLTLQLLRANCQYGWRLAVNWGRECTTTNLLACLVQSHEAYQQLQSREGTAWGLYIPTLVSKQYNSMHGMYS